MSIAYLDTHVAVFLLDDVSKLSKEAERQIEANDLLISPMVYLELDYMYQRKRVSMPADQIYEILHFDFGVQLCHYPFPKVALEASRFRWTNDPFDRIIVAQAVANRQSPLISADGLIRQNYQKTIW